MKKLIIAAVLTAIVAPAGIAQARDKRYPAAICETADGNRGFRRNFWAGAVHNGSSTQVLRLVCPAINDMGAGDVNRVDFIAMDPNPSQNVECFARAQFLDPATGFTRWFNGPTLRTSGFSNRPQQVTGGRIPGRPDANYIFQCTIPVSSGGRQAGLMSYFVDE